MAESKNFNELVSLKRILENDENKQQIVYKTLETILDNILKNPKSEEFRKIYLLSENIVDNLMPYSGGLEFLFEIGFEENDDNLILPNNTDLSKLQSVKDNLDKMFNKTHQVFAKLPECSTTITQNTNTNTNYKEISLKNRAFYSKIEGSFNHVLIYEDLNLKSKALRIIPVDRLKEKSKEKFIEYKNHTKNVNDNEEHEFFLLELLDWYKNEFFQWVNEPDCDYCKTKEFMKYQTSGIPNDSELTWGARNVEVYKCTKCNQTTRFPRYNHPSKLLDTHKGRCGEWANCFTLCLRSLDYEARYVLDWTDHVWSEVYSKSQKRWLHIDPCEATLDKPLVYEHGWGKKLSYVIAFSNEEIIDVTWRYSSKHKDVLTRRNECSEVWLVQLLSRMNKFRQQHLSDDRKKELEMRKVTELVEFLTPKSIKEGEDIGRQSGSLQWRLSRGEMGNDIKQVLNYVIKPNENELKCSRLNIRYNTANNSYYRVSEPNPIKSWNSLIYSYSNIQLKIEQDWKMCYLARTEGSTEASIEWYFDFSDNIKVKEFRLRCKSTCYESGEIKWSIINEIKNETLDVQNINGDFNLFKNFSEFKKFKLKVEMRKGNGSNAFQHTQLFRQKLDDFNLNLFELDFIFE